MWGNGAERPRLVSRPSVGDGVPETLDGKNPAVYLVNYFQFSSVSPDQSTTRLYGFTPPAVCALLSGVRVGSELASVACRQAVLRLYFLVKPQGMNAKSFIVPRYPSGVRYETRGF